jgi:outer membrane translocation and assembly module TamA
MSDEDFESYKSELSTLRESILAELEKTKEESDPEEKAEEKSEESEEAEEKEGEKAEEEAAKDPKEEEVEEKEEAEEETEDVEPAQIDPKHAISAALNFEVYPTEDMKDKYLKMGQAMASLMVKKED